jgi:methionyl-tRNA synthetase
MQRKKDEGGTVSTFLVTTTPPTPNGDLHVGHLSGPYLGADVFVRYQRMRGNAAFHVCSADDHQSYVVTTAARRGCSPEELADRYARAIKSTLRAADIELDMFTSALHNAQHIAFVQGFFKELYERGVIQAKSRPALYCQRCARHLFESFASGKCPYCGEGASGNLCEACGRINDPVELVEPVCNLCRARPVTVEHRGLYFPMEPYRAALAEYYATRSSWRPHLRALCRWLVERPLPDYPASYPTSWGIPVPVEGFSGDAINVWLEMYPGHIATTHVLGELRGDPTFAERMWGTRGNVVQFLGYDNSFFNAVLHVALALGSGGRYAPPEHIITNEFYLLGSEKFSTSRDHAVWGSDILKTVPADVLRYFVARTNPEHMQTSFSHEQLARTTERELVEQWSRVINSLLQVTHEACQHTVPTDIEPDLTARGLLGWGQVNLERVYDAEQFSLRSASAVLQAYVEGCADYLDRTVLPAVHVGQPARRQIGSLGHLLKGLAQMAAPLMPSFSQRLWMALGLDGKVELRPWSDIAQPFSGGGVVATPQPWFTAPANDRGVAEARGRSAAGT